MRPLTYSFIAVRTASSLAAVAKSLMSSGKMEEPATRSSFVPTLRDRHADDAGAAECAFQFAAAAEGG